MVAGFKGKLFRFIAFAVTSALLLMLLYNTMINAVPGDTRDYKAVFTNVSGLSTGDDVRAAGVRVGKVKAIEIVAGGARVDFELTKEQPLLDNTGIVMRYQNLLGQRYLSLVQPERRGARLSPGSTVPMARTSPGFDLTELLNGFRPLLDNLQPADVNKLANSVVAVLQGEGGTVEQLLQQTADLTGFVADRDQVIGQVLTNLTPVLNDLAGQGDELKSTVVELRRLMTGLAKDRKQIGESISGLSTLMNDTSDLLAELRKPADTNARLFRQVAATLDEQRPLLGKVLDAFGLVFGSLGRAGSYTNALNVYLCTTWATTNLGEVNLGGNQDGGPFSEVCR